MYSAIEQVEYIPTERGGVASWACKCCVMQGALGRLTGSGPHAHAFAGWQGCLPLALWQSAVHACHQ